MHVADGRIRFLSHGFCFCCWKSAVSLFLSPGQSLCFSLLFRFSLVLNFIVTRLGVHFSLWIFFGIPGNSWICRLSFTHSGGKKPLFSYYFLGPILFLFLWGSEKAFYVFNSLCACNFSFIFHFTSFCCVAFWVMSVPSSCYLIVSSAMSNLLPLSFIDFSFSIILFSISVGSFQAH